MTTPADNVPTIPVLRVALAGGPPPELSLESVSEWFARTSGGRWTPRPRELAPVALPRSVDWYAPAGGMGPAPRNSQALAADALQAWIAAGVRVDHELDERVVIVVPPGFRPHAWRLRNGGVYLGGGRTCRAYALLPADASPWATAHELAHLFLDLPDLGPASGQLGHCLMAPGPAAGDAAEPAPPCAPLRVRLGWQTAVPVARGTRVRDLPVAGCASWSVPEADLVLERTEHDRLVIHVDRKGLPQHPRRIATLALSDRDADRPLLALVAAHARALTRADRPSRG